MEVRRVVSPRRSLVDSIAIVIMLICEWIEEDISLNSNK